VRQRRIAALTVLAIVLGAVAFIVTRAGTSGTPESTAEFVRNEREHFRDIVRELNIQPE